MNKLIEFVTFDEIREAVIEPQKFEYSEHGEWPWLQRVCFWILGKLGAHATTERVSYHQHRFFFGSLIEAIHEQYRWVHSRRGKPPTRVFMGSKDYAELMSQHEPRQYVDITLQQIMGMRLEIVPWMSGVLVLP